MKNRELIIASIVLAVGVALAGWLAGRGLVESRLGHRTVVVKGLSERLVNSDIGFLPIRFSASGPDLDGARTQLEKSEASVFNYLKAKGFGPDDREIQNIQVKDRFAVHRPDNADANGRFLLTEDIIVRSNDVDRILSAAKGVGELLRSGVVLTSDRFNTGPSFVFTKLNDLKPEMLTEATERARQAAEQFAKESGAKVGPIFKANQGVITIGPALHIPGERAQGQIDKKVRVVTTITYFLAE